jgi:hypothetical protein
MTKAAIVGPRRQRTGPDATPAPSQSVPAPTSTTQSIPDAGDPRRIGELLGDWLAIRMAEVDDLVAEARSRVEAIPDQRSLWLLTGEILVRLAAVEQELAELKAGRR